MKKTGIVFIISLCLLLIAGCNKDVAGNVMDEQSTSREQVIFEDSEKVAECYKDILMRTDTAADLESLELKKIIACPGEESYAATDIPVDPIEEQEAREDCLEKLELIRDVYLNADKGTAINVSLSDADCSKMADVISQKGLPVSCGNSCLFPMRNYEKMDEFLNTAIKGESCEEIIYEIHSAGGVSRKKYIFDGTDMYVLTCIGVWSNNNTPSISGIYYTRLKEWEYTEKGWFSYELCVPEPPEVTEIVDGSCLIRIIPLSEEQCEMTRKCVLGLAYQGNNLLCSNWDADHMEEIDYNGLYEYLHMMKYQEKITAEDYPDGIPQEEFESLIMEYLPVTAEQIREYAVPSDKEGFYAWDRLGCGNYAPNFFGTSYPEVTNVKTNDDGTVTLTVDAVCDMVIHNDAVMSHELTIQFYEDGRFKYLGNKILYNGLENIPEYQYRFQNR